MEATKRFFHDDITVWTSSSAFALRLRPGTFFLLFLGLNLLLVLCRCPLTDARDPTATGRTDIGVAKVTNAIGVFATVSNKALLNESQARGISVRALRRSQIFCAIVGTLITGPETIAVQAAPRQRPCAEIRAACEQAGFVQGGSQTGDGLFVDCIVPILKGRPQPRRATKPLPEIDLQLVSACKAQNPNFGQRSASPVPTGDSASPGPAAEPAQVAPARRRNAQPSLADEPPAQAISPPPASAPLQGMPAPRANEGRIDEE